jgi:hypothetical protein
MMLKERSSGIGGPNFGEMNGSCLTLVKKRLCKNEVHGKLLRAPRMVLSKVQHRIHFDITNSWSNSNTSAPIHQN